MLDKKSSMIDMIHVYNHIEEYAFKRVYTLIYATLPMLNQHITQTKPHGWCGALV